MYRSNIKLSILEEVDNMLKAMTEVDVEDSNILITHHINIRTI